MKNAPVNRQFIETKLLKTKSKLKFKPVPYLLNLVLKLTGFKDIAYKNAGNLILKKEQFIFSNLAEEFSGFKILFITDTHINGSLDTAAKILSLTEKEQWDLCIFGGDYCKPSIIKDFNETLELRKLVESLSKISTVLGVLGNNDFYITGHAIEKSSGLVLINDNFSLMRNNKTLSFCGIDDLHHFKSDDIEESLENVPDNSFKILISHSPEIYKKAEKSGFDLLLSGHTHGGQICLPGGRALFKQAKIERSMINGKWNYRNLQGYTSPGAGCCVTPARFNCPPEITLITLLKEKE